MAPPPALNAAVAKPELDFLHRVLGLNPTPSLQTDWKDVVFVCIDCEAFEFDQKKVTEVGVAVLDTKDIAGMVPGEHGEDWVAKMKYAHYRPAEWAKYVNRRFVKGCEDKFAFGDTTWINLKDAATVLSRIFQCPERLSEAAAFETDLPDSKRNVVFVAHGLSNDDAYLTQVGFKLSQTRNVVRQVDSQRVAGGTKKKGIGLSRLLQKLGMQTQGLHNGANDAAYTLQALIVMAVKEHQQPGVIFGPNELPKITLPGVVRNAGRAAPHVYGGTSVQGPVPLPINGGKHAQTNAKKRSVQNTLKKAKQTLEGARSYSTGEPSNLGRHTVKRPSPEDTEQEDQPVRKRTSR